MKPVHPVRQAVRELQVGEGLVVAKDEWAALGLRHSLEIYAHQWIKENGNGKKAKVTVRTTNDGKSWAVLRLA